MLVHCTLPVGTNRKAFENTVFLTFLAVFFFASNLAPWVELTRKSFELRKLWLSSTSWWKIYSKKISMSFESFSFKLRSTACEAFQPKNWVKTKFLLWEGSKNKVSSKAFTFFVVFKFFGWQSFQHLYPSLDLGRYTSVYVDGHVFQPPVHCR